MVEESPCFGSLFTTSLLWVFCPASLEWKCLHQGCPTCKQARATSCVGQVSLEQAHHPPALSRTDAISPLFSVMPCTDTHLLHAGLYPCCTWVLPLLCGMRTGRPIAHSLALQAVGLGLWCYAIATPGARAKSKGGGPADAKAAGEQLPQVLQIDPSCTTHGLEATNWTDSA